MSAPTEDNKTHADATEHAEGSDPLLLQFLAERDARCPDCHYNLRDLTHDRCPECGQVLRLELAMARPRMGWFIVGVLGLTVPFAIYLFTALVMLNQFRQYGLHDMPIDCIAYIVLAIPLSALLIWIWIRSRLQFAGADLPVRWGGAASCWLLCLLQIIGLLSVFEFILHI